MVEQDEITGKNADIEYVKKINEATNTTQQKSEQPKEQPKKEPLRKRIQQRAQQYVKAKQEKEYEKKVSANYHNFYVQDSSLNWQLYKSVHKADTKTIKQTKDALIKQNAIFKESEGDPAQALAGLNTYGGRLKETWKQNIKEQISYDKEKEKWTGTIVKNVPSFVEDIGQTFTPNRSGMPSMGVPAWGSMQQPQGSKSPYPAYQSYQIRPRAPAKPKKPKKQYISHDDYQSLLQQGLTEEVLAENGVESKRSKYYQEVSPFGRSVAHYRPLSSGQLFGGTVPNYVKTEYQKRVAEGKAYESFYPPFAGEPDESGRSTLIFTPLFVRSPSQSKPLFQPRFVSKPAFNPMFHVEYDAQGNPIKRFFKPPSVRI